MMIEFQPWPKTPRLFRDVVITEKIDGTNAAIHIVRRDDVSMLRGEPTYLLLMDATTVEVDGVHYAVAAQSRKRLIMPESDNFGFARWVWDNAEALVRTLGEGLHFGEWWGSGVQRGYGLQRGDKRFSLFNVHRWHGVDLSVVPGLGAVPVLYQGPFNTAVVEYWVECLRQGGSKAAPGFVPPEGVVVFHTQSRQVYKVLLENDELPKSLVTTS